jgi:single-strand selective monofunctional uracil DNA glycosylase
MQRRVRALLSAVDQLNESLSSLRFAAPVSHVYNPLVYAREAHADYLRRYAESPKHVLFLGMNPGPFGMAQTGVPFGEVKLVRDWLGIRGRIDKPAREHPQRRIVGFDCARSEVSGARLWGLFRDLFETPERFFAWGFVANYCPLVFMEESGRNLTPDKLPRAEREPLLAACDAHLSRVVDALEPRWVVGVGAFAKARAEAALGTGSASSRSPAAPRASAPRIGSIPHPSPASPAANRNWAESARQALAAQRIELGDIV